MIWFANEFILMKCPQLANSLDKKALSAVAAHRQGWLAQTVQSISRLAFYLQYLFMSAVII